MPAAARNAVLAAGLLLAACGGHYSFATVTEGVRAVTVRENADGPVVDRYFEMFDRDTGNWYRAVETDRGWRWTPDAANQRAWILWNQSSAVDSARARHCARFAFIPGWRGGCPGGFGWTPGPWVP